LCLEAGGEGGLGFPLGAGGAQPAGDVGELAGVVLGGLVERVQRFFVVLDYLDNAVGASDGLGC
jgi:hypothetical protein